VKHFSPISKKSLNLILKGEPVFIKGLHYGLLPLVLDFINKKFIVICSDGLLARVSTDLSLYIEERGVYYDNSLYDIASRGAGGYAEERLGLFKAAYASSFKNKSFLITSSEGFYKKTILSQQKESGFVVDSSSEHHMVVGALKGAGYRHVDFVSSPGDFSVRGFVVDFLPKESSHGVRVLFDDNETFLFYFDIKTQLTLRGVSNFFIVRSREASSRVSLFDVLPSVFLPVYLGEDGVRFLSKQTPNEELFSLKYISPERCVSEVSKDAVDNKCYGGFIYNERVFVPSWLCGDRAYSIKDTGDAYVDFSSLEVGDFLIHEDFGVGEYVGLSDVEGQEFLVLKYRDAQIRVFPSFFDKISLFKKSGDVCDLDSIGRGSSWKRRVSSTKKGLSVFVESLYENYMQRKQGVGQKFYIDPEIESAFLQKFSHTDTPDQQSSWLEIKKDLCSPAPMERLLCGDVGFGKTEIAMRAAFLVSVNGGGVVVVAPTTVLAKQLFISFCERLGFFDIKVGFLSRFVSASEGKKTVDLFVNREIDVLVGTHRALNNEDCLKVASLLIVDDEHRFGVKQKDAVKSIKTDINILYMSATPIPRTLNLALSKFSNISLISTPPPLKVSPKTYVSVYDFDLIKRALVYEYARRGQSFIIHNNIKTMPGVVSKIKKSLPFLRVDFVHAQEDPSIIDKKMDLFVNKETDVLVASTILENGINIKNVNTVIINNAHLFGVSQLYQIRGRVGRGSTQSFSYLLYPKKHSLSISAKRRLNIIKNNSSLGSCYSVSMEDMKSRGSGALFGYKQSGGVASVGLELYGKLLKEASSKKSPIHTSVSSSSSAFISADYLPSTRMRVWCYKEISLIKKYKDIPFLKKKIINMFGPMPRELDHLLFIRSVELLGAACGFKKISQVEGKINILLHPSVWNKKAVFLVEILKPYSFSFIKGGEGFSFLGAFDDNFILILKEICARLKSEK
tara:strand:- start:6523 stop:9408 length:2886 start_codon:yes stop_codon:yes gene_type:complete